MKFKSLVYSSASGSAGGLTYSHNRGGMYTRARAVPVNSHTQQQQAVRNVVTLLTATWSNTLTQAQRDGWETYALNTPMTDTLGDPRNVGGLAMFVRSNTPRLQAGKTTIITAPPTSGFAVLSTISALADVSNQDLAITFVTADTWANALNGHLFVYQSRAQNQGINFFNGPYRFLGAVNGNTTPPTSPATFTAKFPFTLVNKLFVYGRASNADGKLSGIFRVQATVQA